MMVRLATLIDVPALLDLSERMHAESAHADLAFSRDKMRALLVGLIDSAAGLAIVAERQGEIIGAFIGCEDEHYCSYERCAFDLALYVAPEHRGGLAAARLLKTYIAWGTERGSRIFAGIASGINHDVSMKLYRRMGFVATGSTYEYQGKP